jgi:hypothetical protein
MGKTRCHKWSINYSEVRIDSHISWNDRDIVAATNVSNTWLNISGTFTPASSGTYYVGILGTTNYTPWHMWIDDVSLESLTNPPNPTVSPSPADLATGVYSSPTLTWANGGGGPTDYNVYFGTMNPPTSLVSANQTGTTYSPGTLTYNQTYYWMIDPHNDNGLLQKPTLCLCGPLL